MHAFLFTPKWNNKIELKYFTILENEHEDVWYEQIY